MALHLPRPAVAPGLMDSVDIGFLYDLRLSLWDQTKPSDLLMKLFLGSKIFPGTDEKTSLC